MHQDAGQYDLSGVVPAIAPPVAVTEALAQRPEGSEDLQESLIRHRLAAEYRLSERNLVLIKDLDAALAGIAGQTSGPLVLFPPSATSVSLLTTTGLREVVQVVRGFGRNGTISVETASDLPHSGVAIVASPCDPLGNVLTANDAVRLARSCAWLVIDERYADYAGQSLLNVASEFPNVIVLRSFQARLGPTGANPGWAVGSPRAHDFLQAISAHLPPGVAQAVLAAGASKAASRMLLSLVRDERSRLFRSLRKLSYLQPLPSWAPFVAARVEIGGRNLLVELLAARGIRIHAPQEAGLESFLRIGIGPRSSMEHLRQTLLEVAPEMLGGQLASSGCDAYRFTLSGKEFGQPKLGQVEKRGHRSS
ncbi:MAG: aminotransferase class I/II-fold pyridoxal phosphate-dependent enzyme [Thermomicrobiales bacterium]|nr:aminotransferase class I/II-fold pyridoxal phosphate-dependent enzyme [Thermomicrobiales bacterium]